MGCSVASDIWKTQLYLHGDFDPERLYLQQEDVGKSQYNMCIKGRYAGKVWRYDSFGGVTKRHSRSVYYNRGKSNAWGDLDENDFFEALLIESLPGEVPPDERTELVCNVGAGGAVEFIGVGKNI